MLEEKEEKNHEKVNEIEKNEREIIKKFIIKVMFEHNVPMLYTSFYTASNKNT